MWRTFQLGASMTASWAWGSSLMVGMAIILERGLIPFLIWATANSLMLPFFGYMVKKYPQFEKTTMTKPFILLMTIMQFFVTWVNMQAIYMVATQVGMGDIASKILASVVAHSFRFNGIQTRLGIVDQNRPVSMDYDVCRGFNYYHYRLFHR